MVPEDLAKPDQPVAKEDRHGCAEVGDMADTAATVVRVVPEKDITWVNIPLGEILENWFNKGRIRTPRQLASAGIKQCDPIIVLVADHRRPRCPLDCCFNFKLSRPDGASNNLKLNRPDNGFLSRFGFHVSHDIFSSLRLPYASETRPH